MSKLIDLTGQRFGRLTVIHQAGYNRRRLATWVCCCECGKTVVYDGATLRQGHATSCGCGKNKNHIVDKHLYFTWRDMRQRCLFPHHPSYPNYGGRGIHVCKEWENSYPAFQTWALQNGWEPRTHSSLTLDRIDNDGPYSPDNCRFTDRWTQANNRRKTTYLTLDGRTMSLSAWSKVTGICQSTLYRRIGMGWPTERVLTEPIQKHEKSK